VGFDQVLDDGESQTGAAGLAGTGRVDPIVTLEDARQMI
jgi:hypothetical protein